MQPHDIDQTQAHSTAELEQIRPTDFSLVCRASGERRRVVVPRTHLFISSKSYLVVDEQEVQLHTEHPDIVTVNGAAFSGEPLRPGDEIAENGRAFVLESSPVVAFLEGLTPPHQGTFWPLGEESVTVGRPGKRDNTISLLDKTVSREQATLTYQQGRFVLIPEAASSTSTVNGRPVEQKMVLRNGDLLAFGQQIVRFQSNHDTFGAGQGTIFFCDVWDYSNLFHGRAVHEVAQLMREFYEAAGEVVEGNGGLVLRYIGDALLAAFSEDGHADSAVAAGLALQARLAELNADWATRGMPVLQVGVGINSGEFAVGHMGFAGYIEFGALGPDVNMAARIEKLTRDHDSKVLLGESTATLLTRDYPLHSLGRLNLKGAQEEIEVFAVV